MAVTITKPASGAMLTGLATVEATYTGQNFDTATVTVDGQQLASDSAKPIAFSIDTTRVPDGPHTLTVAVRYRTNGGALRWQKASIPITTEGNDMEVVLSTNKDTSNLTGTVVVTATVTPPGHASPLTDCKFYVDNVLQATDTSYPLTFSWDTTLLDDGDYVLKAVVVAKRTKTATLPVKVKHVVLPPPIPVNTALPAITGTLEVASTIACSTGSWTNTPDSFVYRWRRCDQAGAACGDIPGASGPTYLVAAADHGYTLRCVVTAYRDGNVSMPATTAATAVITSAPPPVSIPVNSSLPTIDDTTPIEGQTLSALLGVWTNNPTSYTYQWRRCTEAGLGCVDVAGATSQSVTLSPNETDRTIRVAVTAHNAAGASSEAVSTFTALVTAPAPPPPPTEVQATWVQTFEHVGIYWKPNGRGAAVTVAVEYRLNGAGSWVAAYPLWYDTRNTEYRGIIRGLSENSVYEVKLTLSTGGFTTFTFRTWTDTPVISQTITVPCGTAAAPRTTAFTTTLAGFVDANGVEHYVKYVPAVPTSNVIDVNGAAATCITVNHSYVIIEGFDCRDAAQWGVSVAATGPHHVRIQDNDISGWGRIRAIGSPYGLDLDGGVDCRPVSTASIRQLVIQRNRIHDPRYPANTWALGHPQGPHGILISTANGASGNNVIRENEIYSTSGRCFNDGMGGNPNYSAVAGFMSKDSVIARNIVRDVMDDAIEAEGSGKNCLVEGNYMSNTYTGVASAGVMEGPLYIHRNVLDIVRRDPAENSDTTGKGPFGKSGGSDGRRYFFHNTVLEAGPPAGKTKKMGAWAGPDNAGGAVNNTHMRNNIWHSSSSASIYIGTGTGNDIDYDLCSGSITAGGAVIGTHNQGPGTPGTPIYTAGHGGNADGTRNESGNYELASNSPGYQDAVSLPNFNIGAGADMGAAQHEDGAMAIGVP